MTPDSIGTDGGRTVLRMERPLPHPPEKVWRALTEPAHLAAWFPSTVEIDLRDGGEILFDGGDTRGRVTALEPPHVLAFTWGDDDHLRWEVRPDGPGTVLVLHHAFTDHHGAASFATGWSACVGALAESLGSTARPVDMVARHEEYVREFDLDAPVLDGGRVRIERQLTAPADRVRPLLAPVAGVTWELTEGTGHGARLIATATDPAQASVLRTRVAEIAAAAAAG
ncbi:SRPBCC family protein [Pseudonocardia ailaonensis]|uniref:SRPBCC family protein n=1 Tax=Pseudonocardia ailaonensis TaxID=367279 RepID=A0ABN2N7B8_9PSEU